ncbi:MAG: helix-turn-helix domain-containing protein [Desulfobacteraceae bacterium]|nr:helix-turn-helix domain-containing protein [Desulfobacteraceae bacterium]
MDKFKTVEEWEQVLGGHIRALRIQRNIDQRDLAAQAGVALNAVKSLESGRTVTTKTLISVLRVLNRTDWIESLSPPISINPLKMLDVNAPRQKIYKERKHTKSKG